MQSSKSVSEISPLRKSLSGMGLKSAQVQSLTPEQKLNAILDSPVGEQHQIVIDLLDKRRKKNLRV